MRVELSVDNHEEKGDPDSSVPLSCITCIEEVFTETLMELDPGFSRYISVDISLSLFTENEIRELNRQYRDIDEATDVLSFPLWEKDGTFDPPSDWKELALGDIVICPSFVKKFEDSSGSEEDYNFNIIISHGFLHLLGWDHVCPEDEKRMIDKQERMAEKIEDCIKNPDDFSSVKGES